MYLINGATKLLKGTSVLTGYSCLASYSLVLVDDYSTLTWEIVVYYWLFGTLANRR